MKRILLFLGTNLAILLVLTAFIQIFGIDRWLVERGYGDYTGLLVLAAIFGMGGSFISLAVSKWMAKTMMRVRVIDQPRSADEQWLVQTVQRQARQAGIGMPEVGVYESPVMNAFATGMSRDNALVAVSSGLLQNMDRDGVEAVLGHEVSHVANGDMVTLGLIQGVLNTFVIFFAHVVARLLIRGERGSGFAYFGVVIVLEIIFGLIASIIVAWFSRYREFRADVGGARLADRRKMVLALKSLQKSYGESDMPKELAAFGISGRLGQGWRGFSPATHRYRNASLLWSARPGCDHSAMAPVAIEARLESLSEEPEPGRWSAVVTTKDGRLHAPHQRAAKTTSHCVHTAVGQYPDPDHTRETMTPRSACAGRQRHCSSDW
uniref:protease HtpX n=1 Tax=Kineobactrum salinum TaxID=2708301 RepID=UPI002F968CF2